MKSVFGILIAGCAAVLLCSPARANTLFTIAPVTLNVSSGDTGDAFDVLLTNNGPSAISVAAFTFEVTVADTDITLTGADFSPSVDPYIFAGNSFDQSNSLTLNFTGPDTTAQTLQAADSTADSTGVTLNAGTTLALGEVLLNVSPTATSGSFTTSFTGTPDATTANSLSDPTFNGINVDSLVSGNIDVDFTPEPSPLLLMLVGISAVLGLRARARR